jgi:hypothetical protein
LASATLADISWVALACSATIPLMASVASFNLPMISATSLIALTASSALPWTPLMRLVMSSAAWALWLASSFISWRRPRSHVRPRPRKRPLWWRSARAGWFVRLCA